MDSKWMNRKPRRRFEKDGEDFTETLRGLCRVDFYRRPGDLYPGWDIAPASSGRIPDATRGQIDRTPAEVESASEVVRLVEVYRVWDQNGWRKSSVDIWQVSEDGSRHHLGGYEN